MTVRLLIKRETNLFAGPVGTNARPEGPLVKPRIVLMEIDLRGI